MIGSTGVCRFVVFVVVEVAVMLLVVFGLRAVVQVVVGLVVVDGWMGNE